MAGKKDVTAYKRPHKLKYGKWGLIFILPFFICYGIFQLYPLIATFYRSFFHDKTDIFLNSVFEFAGFENYIDLFTKYDIVKYFGNTMLLWLLGFIPQIIVSLLFASWFTDIRLKLKGTGAVKVILYLPNMLMASSIAVLFGKLFAVTGPINHILGTSIHFLENEWGIRLIIAFINFLMWFGNTTILLMAGIMGIDQSLFEAASIDGATSGQVFFKITLPLLMPILLYVAITSLIGGLQMFDVPQIITAGSGSPNNSCMTLIMYLNRLIGSGSKNYGMGGAVSVVIFILTGALSMIVFKTMVTSDDKPKKKAKKVKEAVKNG